jgi:hypothetical protein
MSQKRSSRRQSGRQNKSRRHQRKHSSKKSSGGSSNQIVNQAVRRLQQFYSQNGSSKVQVGGMDINDMVSKIISNRVLDLYLKYLGLTMLNSATLVPFALILGKDYFEKYLMSRMSKEQSGGGEPLPRVVPLIDHPYVGTFLKIAGIPVIGLTTNTLVPLGILMIVYEMIKKLSNGDNQTGGRRRHSSKRRSAQRGGYGSAFTSLYAIDASAPVQNTYDRCLNFTTQENCQQAAAQATQIQQQINPPASK